jgi:hypothetical protein
MGDHIIKAGVRELSLAHVAVTKKGGLCTKTQPIDTTGLPERLIDSAKNIETKKTVFDINRLPERIMLNGKISGVCKWTDEKVSETDSSPDIKKAKTSESYKGDLSKTFKQCRISGLKNDDNLPSFDIVKRMRLNKDDYIMAVNALDTFCKDNIPTRILLPLKTKDTYDKPSVNQTGETSCSKWTNGDKKFVITEIVNGDVAPQFFGSKDTSFSSSDRIVGILALASYHYTRFCSDKIGYFVKFSNRDSTPELYYCRIQTGYKIIHQRFGVEIHVSAETKERMKENFTDDYVGPIWAGDTITLQSEIGQQLQMPSKISFSFT